MDRTTLKCHFYLVCDFTRQAKLAAFGFSKEKDFYSFVCLGSQTSPERFLLEALQPLRIRV